MEQEVAIDDTYVASEDVVAREIEGEFILVPLSSGIGDMEDEIYTLNETGRAIWERLDGKKSLLEIAEALKTEFDSKQGEIEEDVAGLVKVLLERKMVSKA
jgi:hypothetical protein